MPHSVSTQYNQHMANRSRTVNGGSQCELALTLDELLGHLSDSRLRRALGDLNRACGARGLTVTFSVAVELGNGQTLEREVKKEVKL